MIVSWNWLQDYLDLDVPAADVAQRLMMSGLNHEGTERRGADLAIDLEVTSNRPDCLGHLGVAREIAVLFGRRLNVPEARPRETGPPASELIRVGIDCPELCYRYSARIIRGVRIGPSPAWLADRLRTLGIAVINNIVDATNYVLMESGQPLHAFDLDRLRGEQVLVRQARQNEEFLAIDHRSYRCDPTMCLIADAERAVALGGVMGGVDSEVSEATTNLLIESAEFDPLSIRGTARKLNLHSPSSHRFERGVDPVAVDWASRRCCELILELAGGELATGVVAAGRDLAERSPVRLRIPQVKRVLGIDVATSEVRRILTDLGCDETRAEAEWIEVVPPSWRRDLTREIDLIEEVARIHGYDRIPENVAVPMWPSSRTDSECVLSTVRTSLTSLGFDEALTASMTPQEWSAAFSPWTDAPPLMSSSPMKGVLADAPQDLGQADTIRRSLVPSLLEARRYNESVGNRVIELFEIARVYLPRPGQLPDEPRMLAVVSAAGYYQLKGTIEALLVRLHNSATLAVHPTSQPLLDADRSAEFRLDDQLLGFLGEITPAAVKRFGLRNRVTVAEVRIETLAAAACLVPQYAPQTAFPAISRDLNLIVSEEIRWADLVATVRDAASELLRDVSYCETYRDPATDGPGKKRVLFSLALRSGERTLTNEEADAVRDAVVAACATRHGARLLG